MNLQSRPFVETTAPLSRTFLVREVKGCAEQSTSSFLTRPATTSQGAARLRTAAHRGNEAKPIKAAAVEEASAPVLELSDVQLWGDNKRLQTQVSEVAKDTITIRSLDHDRDRFDIEFGLQNGTTYNSFLIFGEEKTALVDASHEKFRELYIGTLKEQLKAAGRKIDYVFVSHTEPDHSGLTPDIIDIYPDATVVGSKVALMYLKSLTHRPFEQKVVKGGDKIDLGGGHVVEFIMAPNLHWPDTIFSFDHATGVIYTCDAFGMHYCDEEVFDTELEELSPHLRFYYDCLMKPNARSVLTALKKIKELDYSTIATGHGPLLRHNVEEIVGRYQKWSEGVSKAPAIVAVIYCAEYGYADRLSQTIARGITKAGVQTEMIDALSADPQEVTAIVGKCAGVVLLAPPRESAEAQATIATLLSSMKPKQKVMIAESYGGKDEPVDTLIGSFVDISVQVTMDPLRIKEKPTEKIYQGYEEAGTDMAQLLTKKESAAKARSMSPEVAKALARLSSGLYVVTAGTEGTAKGAMVASWVSQASFEPLGLSIAVAKDRAIESLMQVGDRFVLNCLGEDTYGRIMKHFLQRFPPGADRFEGIDTLTASNGTPALSEAIAFLECRVRSRMEVPDHWILYAEVTKGSLTDSDKKTAVHRRKMANYY